MKLLISVKKPACMLAQLYLHNFQKERVPHKFEVC